MLNKIKQVYVPNILNTYKLNFLNENEAQYMKIKHNTMYKYRIFNLVNGTLTDTLW